MKKITAYEIALSALATALATVFLTVGVYTEILLFTGYLFAGLALMLPLSKRSFVGYILAYIATCLLALIFTSFRFWDLLPFAIFFGLHPLVNECQLCTKYNRWVWFGIKAVWFDISMFVTWKFLLAMTTSLGGYEKFILPIILIVGTAFFYVYDNLTFRCRAVVNTLVKRINKRK